MPRKPAQGNQTFSEHLACETTLLIEVQLIVDKLGVDELGVNGPGTCQFDCQFLIVDLSVFNLLKVDISMCC